MNSNITSRPPRSKGLAHVALRMLNLEAPVPRARIAAPTDAAPLPPSQRPCRVVDPLLPLADAAAVVRVHRTHADDGSAEEMDAMLRAVIARLRLTVDERYLATHDERSREHAHRLRTSVLECVSALEGINQTLVHEFGSRQPAHTAEQPRPRR